MMRSALAPLVALALAPLALRAQDARLDARLDTTTRAVVLRTIDTARQLGLPVEPLLDKALEGATKRATGPRIESAVTALLQRMQVSRDALAPNAAARDIVAGADALAYGATREALHTMRAIRPNGSLAVPLAVLTQLVASGVPIARATRVVADLLKRGARDEQLIALQEDVRSYVSAGAAPEAALDVRTRGLNAVLPPGGAAGAAGDGGASSPTAASTGGPKKP
jgi:hypothetical protein